MNDFRLPAPPACSPESPCARCLLVRVAAWMRDVQATAPQGFRVGCEMRQWLESLHDQQCDKPDGGEGMSDTSDFGGLTGTRCEHRIVGERAWCIDCQEWCAPPDDLCARCLLVRAAAWMRDIQAAFAEVGNRLFAAGPDVEQLRYHAVGLAASIERLADALGDYQLENPIMLYSKPTEAKE